MTPNWNAFSGNLKDISSAFGGMARKKLEMADAIKLLQKKAEIEAQFNPDVQFMNWIMDGAGNQPQQAIDTTGMDMGTGKVVGVGGGAGMGVVRGKLIRGLLSKKFGIPYEELQTPEEQTAGIERKAEEAKAVKKAQMTEEINVKRQQYAKDLVSFLAIDDILQEARGEGGVGRFKAGLGMTVRGITQKGKLGQAVGAYDAVSKRLRVQLVRAAGDVGNINIVEQEAAEKLIPAKSDSKQTATIKRAYLIEISKAIDSQDPNLVKATLDKMGVKYTDLTQKKDFSNLWE